MDRLPSLPGPSSIQEIPVIENVLNALACGTPALRERYLERVRGVSTPEARELETRLTWLVEEDRRRVA